MNNIYRVLDDYSLEELTQEEYVKFENIKRTLRRRYVSTRSEYLNCHGEVVYVEVHRTHTYGIYNSATKKLAKGLNREEALAWIDGTENFHDHVVMLDPVDNVWKLTATGKAVDIND